MKLKSVLTILLMGVLFVGLVACNPEETTEEPPQLDTRYTDELHLIASFEGKEFIADGIGEVVLSRVVDGDTIIVRSGSTTITIRFLGIDTPESTGRVEPWGMAASQFVKDILENAHSIVLEAEGQRIDSTGRRYLAWIWYQAEAGQPYRNINLEIIENAYSRFTLGQTKYYDTLLAAHLKTDRTKLRVYGQQDPNFNYSRESVEVTLAYILENNEEFNPGSFFLIEAVVTRMVGHNFYLEDLEETEIDGEMKKGYIYTYTGYGAPYANHLNVGTIVRFEAQLQYKGDFGTQLTGVKNLSVIGAIEGELDVLEFEGTDFTSGADLEQYEGRVIKVTGLKLTSIHQSANDITANLYTLTFENANGQSLSVRLGGLISQYSRNELIENEMYTVVGAISYYEFATGQYQIVVGDKNKSIDLIRE